MVGLAQLDELQKILIAEASTAGGDGEERIGRCQAGPGERE
jgi:hypothetical protein